MREINFSAIIIEKRREKGITQEELAANMGVTKASVSKWETGQSYPDIVLLPLLASYFDISIDCLMGYTPQMSESDIKKLYTRLAMDFTDKPFEEVIAECEGIVKKYYSCYPLLVRMSLLYANHAQMAGSEERSKQLFMEAIRLSERAATYSKDKHMICSAAQMQAMCYLSLNQGEKVLEVLGESLLETTPDGTLIAQAYLMLGNVEKAQETLQVDLFQHLMDAFQSLIIILHINLACFEKGEPAFLRAESLSELFNMKRLNASKTASMYILGAQMYVQGGFHDKAIAQLSKFADVCTKDLFPIVVRGDEFFDRVDNFLTDSSAVIPRSDVTIKKIIMEHLHDPLFEPLKDNVEYKRIVRLLSDLA
jgi:transcriptional regulator with XRE-family HTH domain